MTEREKATRISLRITLVYGVLAGIWIVVSDYALMQFFGSPASITRMQTYKGWVFVLATAAVLFIVLYTQIRALLSEYRMRREAQLQAQDVSNRLQHYLEMSPVVTYALNYSTNLHPQPAWVSENIHSLLGYQSHEALSPSWWLENVYPEDRARVLSNQEALLERGSLVQEFRLQHRDGHYLWIGDHVRLVRDSHGKPWEAIGTWHDITRRKEAESTLQQVMLGLEEQVEKAVEKARQQDSIIFDQMRRQSLNRLLLNLAHQWRQPLNVAGLAIQEIADLISPDHPDYPMVEEKINQSMDFLQKLSRTINTMSALQQSGDHPPTRLNLVSLINQARTYLEATTDNPKAHIATYVPDDIAITAVEVDIVEILMELITNAISIARHRGLPHINIDISARKAGSRVKIEIADDGGGFDDDILPTVFDPYTTSFFKSHDKGLGLYMIRRQIEEFYHGSVEALNRGPQAVVTITLPFSDESGTQQHQ
ncbi:PAS domain-containing protein [Desulfurispira natronophila]|uniref:histidine kinase n=1 Tax=Desulfurispira natronophila TaxID=682562 RepID=A0A7W8DGA4_9BACT|nr:PAS domain-containing sensor histidine kinase [Desulfurispira natronophila]MBB5021210.1 PAS domain S-box-containing protein [Desulfurispira natronophila]